MSCDQLRAIIKLFHSAIGKTRLAVEFLRAMEYTVEKYPYQGNMPKAGGSSKCDLAATCVRSCRLADCQVMCFSVADHVKA